MLNISQNSINDFISLKNFKSYDLLKKSRVRWVSFLLTLGLIAAIIFSMFLPWTQNINANGYVTTRTPQQRPQPIHSVISGRIEKWYVQEGDFVKAGDNIIFLSEVKSEYFDPNLIKRTTEQVAAKSKSIKAYDDKVAALENQFQALQEALPIKLEQTRNKIEQVKNKIEIDSVDLTAFNANIKIAEDQYLRIKQLHEKGLKTRTELQEKEQKLQNLKAKILAQENKVLNQKSELINLRVELFAIEKEYADKLAKSQSEQQSALSAKLESMAATAKLKNQLSNYKERQKFYHIKAPQSGYVTKAIKKGIGSVIKEGVDIVTIMPEKYNLAVEVYLKPQDLPLIRIGEDVRMRFDGWPAVVISGWPEGSTGVFSGEIVAIDQFIGDNGYYRTLISPSENQKKKWPKQLRVGTGVQAFILLNNVPIWYELWRQLNGFAPDFYKNYKEDAKQKEKEIKRKAPIKSVK